VQTLRDGTCITSLAGSKAKRAELLARVFQDKFHQCDCAEKLCAQDLSSGVQALRHGTCIASLAGSKARRAELLARAFQDKFQQCDCTAKLSAQDLSKAACNQHTYITLHY